MSLQQWLHKLKDNYQLEIDQTVEGQYSFYCDGMTIHCTETNGRILINADIINLADSEQEQEDICKKLLQLALIQLKNIRETIAWEDSRRTLVLYRLVNTQELNSDLFEELVGNFIDALEFFKENCEVSNQRAPHPNMMLMP